MVRPITVALKVGGHPIPLKRKISITLQKGSQVYVLL
ncbi:hypothetical protein LINPERPRIM_LOCUS4398 [Linum perenne]